MYKAKIINELSKVNQKQNPNAYNFHFDFRLDIHTSLKCKLTKNDFPEERTIYSESS